MTNRLSIIALFVLATLLATGGVELFCRFLDQTLIIAPQPSVAKTSGPARTYSGAKSATPGIASVTGAAGKDYSIIIKRSLFGKPPKKETNEVAPAPTPVLEATSLDLILLGTISGGANNQRAIIQDKRKKTQDIYYKGDAIGPALIKEILRGKVILTVRGKDEVLLMKEPKSSPSRRNATRTPLLVNEFVVEEPEPITEEVIDSDDIVEMMDPETPSPAVREDINGRPEGQNQGPNRSAPPRKVSFKKKNNQVAEP